MDKEIIINIDPDGNLQSLHFDDFNLMDLGEPEVERVSEIVFDKETRTWTVRLFNPEAPGGYEIPIRGTGWNRYENARRFEVEYIQLCWKSGISPFALRWGKSEGSTVQRMRHDNAEAAALLVEVFKDAISMPDSPRG